MFEEKRIKCEERMQEVGRWCNQVRMRLDVSWKLMKMMVMSKMMYGCEVMYGDGNMWRKMESVVNETMRKAGGYGKRVSGEVLRIEMGERSVKEECGRRKLK